MPAISFSHVSFSYTSTPLLENTNLMICDDERVYVVNPSGSGRSTLLRLATGELSPDQGTVSIPEQPGPQAANSEEATATPIEDYPDAVRTGTPDTLDRFERMDETIARAGAGTGSLAEEYDSLLARLESLGAWNLLARQVEALAGLGLGHVDTGRLISSLSQGQQGRLEIAAPPLSADQALVLDEPTNHLDAGSSSYPNETMVSWPEPVLFFSHNHAFINEVVTAVVDLDAAPWQALAATSEDGGPVGACRCAGRYSDYLMEKAHARSPHRSLCRHQQE